MTSSQKLKQLIRNNSKLLSEKMDPDSGLLLELYSQEVISHREMETIKSGKTFYDRNEELLRVMRGKSEAKCQQFVAALRVAEMSHLADLLEVKS